MSVLKSQRGESTVQFLDTARELEIYTIKTCAKFPKRYMFLITKDIVALASAVYNNAKAANSIYVTTADDARLHFAMSIIANRHRTRVCENDRRKQTHKKHRLGAVGNTYHYGGKVACVAEGK